VRVCVDDAEKDGPRLARLRVGECGVALLIFMRDVTHVCVFHDAFLCVPRLNPACGMTDSPV